ncbi:SEC-C metal-binding domain-containing protein [Sulfurovum sp.]|uniref:SEC-C metal-binding domain-containing protein n=1 Tax=Sulfurovum sp. TaxID=1969726 RepID=UPI00356A24EC
MTDIEFITRFSQEAGTHYEKAKSQASDIPAYALVHIRGFVAAACSLVVIKANTKAPWKMGNDLYGKIKYLYEENLLDEESKDWLHKLRINANKGAHPEEFSLSDSEYKDLAYESLETACKLVERLYLKIHGTEPPEFTWQTLDSNQKLRDFCYASIMDSDSMAQYELGKVLQSKARVIEKLEIEEGEKNNYRRITLFKSSKLFDKAFYQFQEARFENADAAYEYAVSLELGYGTEVNLKEAHSWYRTAAYNGSIDAKAMYGTICLSGSDYLEKDIAEALLFLEEAAEADHPMALTNLGVIYTKGKGVKQDLKKSFYYTLQAANAGYPTAQYNLGTMYLNGGPVDINEALAYEYFTLASEQELRIAEFALAELFLLGRGCERDIARAEKLYNHSIETAEEMLLLAGYYEDGTFGYTDNLQAASLLQKAYEISKTGTEANTLAYKKSPIVVQKLRKELFNTALDHERLMISFYFDEKGYPYNNREERMSLFLKKIMQIGDKNKNGQNIEADIIEITPGLLNTMHQPKKTIKQAGRNDPCPCGSGKKYKKCCNENKNTFH